MPNVASWSLPDAPDRDLHEPRDQRRRWGLKPSARSGPERLKERTEIRIAIAIVAFVVGHEETALRPVEVRSWLRARLPEPCIPSRVVMLPALPLNANGKVDRAKLSARVVQDPVAIKQLEQIVHPMLGASRQKFFADAEAAGAPIVVLDIPLLFETGGEKRVDAVVVVTTSPELQRERVLARGTMDAAKLEAIIAKQMPDAEKRKRADFIVDTSHGLDPVRARIRDILAEVVKMPQRRA
jgi:dephospho-CoA kinase